jgi:simple sugar transport system permease protein
MRVHAGLVVGLVAVLAVWVLMKRTVWGMEIRAVGENAPAARYAGIPVTATVLRVALLSGALAGLAGVGEVAGLKGYLTSDLSPGFGYSGIVVAMLAGLSPLGVVAAALFIAAVFVGADSMSRGLGVASYIADLVVALSLLSVLVGGFFTRFRLRLTGRVAHRAAGP